MYRYLKIFSHIEVKGNHGNYQFNWLRSRMPQNIVSTDLLPTLLNPLIKL